jgi:hypothetical protein
MSVLLPRPRSTSGGTTASPGPKSQPAGRAAHETATKVTVGFDAKGQADERIQFVGSLLIGYKVEVQVGCGFLSAIVRTVLRSMPAKARPCPLSRPLLPTNTELLPMCTGQEWNGLRGHSTLLADR